MARAAVGLGAAVAVLATVAAFLVPEIDRDASALAARPPRAHEEKGIHKVRHVIVIMQENRSFDSYFGTFPDTSPSRRGGRFSCASASPGRPIRRSGRG